MLIRYAGFEASLRKRNFYPNYLLFGSDSFLTELARNSLVRALQEASQGQVGLATLDFDEISVDDFLNAAQSLPMFAPRQLLLVKGAMKLREHQGKRLARYFSDPNPRTVVIFLAGDLDKDQRKKKIFEILAAGTRAIELAPFEPRELEEWIRQQAKALDREIESDAIRFLTDLQGSDLGRLQQEVEKAALYTVNDKLITVAAVEAVSGFAAGRTLAEFLDAIGDRNKSRALELIEEIFFAGKETGLAFWWFGQQLRQWLQFKELAGKVHPAIIGKQAGVYSPSAAQRIQQQAKGFSRQNLVRAIQRLASVDDKVKGSSIDARLSMELLVHEVTS